MFCFLFHTLPSPQTSEDSDVVATVVDILIPIAEFNSSIVRDHILSQTETHDEVCVCVCVCVCVYVYVYMCVSHLLHSPFRTASF